MRLITAQVNGKVQQVGAQLSVQLSQLAQLTAILISLTQAQIEIAHLTVNEPSLDDAFMALTVGQN